MSAHLRHTIDTADLIRRCFTKTDLIQNFTDAVDGNQNPVLVDVACRAVVELALDIATEDYEYEHGVIVSLFRPARAAIIKTVMKRAWDAIDLRPPVYPFGVTFDALCQRNDTRRGMAV